MCLVRPRQIGLIRFTELQFQGKTVQKVPCLSMKMLVFGEKRLKSCSFMVTRVSPFFALLFLITSLPSSSFLKLYTNHLQGRLRKLCSKEVATTNPLSIPIPFWPVVPKLVCTVESTGELQKLLVSGAHAQRLWLNCPGSDFSFCNL